MSREPSPTQNLERIVDPTPEEIRESCRQIRQGWSETTRRHRAGESLQRWAVPEARDPTFHEFSRSFRRPSSGL